MASPGVELDLQSRAKDGSSRENISWRRVNSHQSFLIGTQAKGIYAGKEDL